MAAMVKIVAYQSLTSPSTPTRSLVSIYCAEPGMTALEGFWSKRRWDRETDFELPLLHATSGPLLKSTS
jgi:hypothetical protein